MDTTPDATDTSETHKQVDNLTPSLRTVTLGVADDAAIDAPVPEVRATTEERFKDFDLNSVTHVVIQVTIARQTDIFRYVGYQYDWDIPGPFWHFLGKMAAKAILDNRTELHELNFAAVGRREFIAYTTSTWTAAVEAKKAAGMTDDDLPPFRVIEVNFKKPRPGQPLEMTWAPARDMITTRVKRMRHPSERSDEDVYVYVPQGASEGVGPSGMQA